MVHAVSTPQTKAGLCAVLPRGETFRNFVYSGALDHVQQAVGVHALSVLPSPELEQMLRERFTRVTELTTASEPKMVRNTRELLDLAHSRWLWSRGAQDRWQRRELDAPTPAIRRRWRVKKAAATLFASRTGLRWLSALERRMSRRARVEDPYRTLFEAHRPAVVFNASHVHSENAIQAVQAAQWLGIHTATFIYSWDNLTSQGRIMLPYDSYLVWNESLRNGLRALYPWIRPSQIHVTGTPQFDAHFRDDQRLTREELCRRIGADPDRALVVYATGMPNHMPGEPHLVESLADQLAHPDFAGRRPQLVVRVYPKDTSGRFEELATRRPDILFPRIPWEPRFLTPLPEDTALLTNTLRHADVGINVASTVALEHCMFDTPVICVGYNPPRGCPPHLAYARYYDFDHYRPVIASGAVQLAGSPAEMHAMLKAAFEEPAARRTHRKALLERMFADTLDGRSSERVADVLIALVHRARGQVAVPS